MSCFWMLAVVTILLIAGIISFAEWSLLPFQFLVSEGILADPAFHRMLGLLGFIGGAMLALTIYESEE